MKVRVGRVDPTVAPHAVRSPSRIGVEPDRRRPVLPGRRGRGTTSRCRNRNSVRPGESSRPAAHCRRLPVVVDCRVVGDGAGRADLSRQKHKRVAPTENNRPARRFVLHGLPRAPPRPGLEQYVARLTEKVVLGPYRIGRHPPPRTAPRSWPKASRSRLRPRRPPTSRRSRMGGSDSQTRTWPSSVFGSPSGSQGSNSGTGIWVIQQVPCMRVCAAAGVARRDNPSVTRIPAARAGSAGRRPPFRMPMNPRNPLRRSRWPPGAPRRRCLAPLRRAAPPSLPTGTGTPSSRRPG